jgi:predicted PurR-regulated permease PerM
MRRRDPAGRTGSEVPLPRYDPLMPPGEPHLSRLQRLTYRVWFAVGVMVLGSVLVWLLYRPFAVILAPTLLALLIVYLLNPVVSWLEQRRVPRLLGTALAYLAVIGVLAGLAAVVMPLLSAQLQDFGETAPEIGVELVATAQGGVDAVGLDIDLAEVLERNAVMLQLEAFVTDAANRDTIIAFLVGLSGVARGALFFLFAMTVGPVIAFYILVDLPRFKAHARRLIPPRSRAEVSEVAAKLGTVVGGFVRGQLLIALVIGVASSVVLGLIGLRYWLLVGIIAGVTNLVPLLGPIFAGVVGASIAFVTEGFGFAVLVVVAMTAVQQLDGNLMTPLIMGRTVRVHPLAVLLVVLVAGVLYGVFGMLFAVPIAAGVKVVAEHVWQTRVPWAETPAEEGGGGPPEAAGPAAPGAADAAASEPADVPAVARAVPLDSAARARQWPEPEAVER